MIKFTQKLEKFKVPFLLFIILLTFCALTRQSPLNTQLNPLAPQENPSNLHTFVTYEFGTHIIKNNITNENILIFSAANVTLINSTVHGSIYVFNFGQLSLFQNSNITEDLDISDSSKVRIENSTVMRTIKCRDSTVLEIFNAKIATTPITKLNSANITIINSSVASLFEYYGTGGEIQISNSNIGIVSLMGSPIPLMPSLSRVFINNSVIFSLTDNVPPFNVITGPLRFDFMTGNFSYSTSERKINVTWISWDSPIINGYLNLTFQILLDGVPQSTVNGSGFINQYLGHQVITISQLGKHNISVIAFDSNGNNFTSTINVEIIEYPSFPWLSFFITAAVIVLIAVAAMSVLHYKQKRGYHSALGAIFKKELADNKLKIIIFIAIAAVPGLILFFIFNSITRMVGSISIDNIRGLVSMVFTLFLYYFALAFSITFGATSVVSVRRSGTLSWFLSKPLRRWEFLWGKIFAYLIIIILIMASTSIAFVLGGLSFIDPLYIPDIISMGGYIFLIGLAALIPLTAVVMLCSSVFNKIGLAIFIPIILLMFLPTITSFLPILTRSEWPLLLSFSYYYEQLGSVWVYQGGGLFSTIGTTFGAAFGLTITPITITPLQIVGILSTITIVCFALATFYLERKDV